MSYKIVRKTKDKSLVRVLTKYAAWISLLLAFIFGKFIRQDDHFSLLKNAYEYQPVELTKNKDESYLLTLKDSTAYSRIRLGKSQGYGGELLVAVQYDSLARIGKISILKDRETISFVNKLKTNHFFRQFLGKSISDELVAGQDVDAVSGCTVSSVAFTNAIRQSSHFAAQKDFSMATIEPEVKWIFGYEEALVLVLIAISIFGLYQKKKWLRYSTLGVAFALIGFKLNAAISISHFARLACGFLPDPHDHIIWWMLVVIALSFPFFLKKNLYCNMLCPFHAAEIILIKISGFKLKLNKRTQKTAKFTSQFLLWAAFMIIFISENPTLGAYEPFSLLFSLEGAGIQWYLLPTALIGAMFVPEYYCRFFCPVGRTLGLIIKARKSIDKYYFSVNRKTVLKSINSKINFKKTG